MSFHVGQLVVCVDDRPRRGSVVYHLPVPLRRGTVYTIIDTGVSNKGAPIVRIAEALPHKGSSGFFADRFRPVDETRLEVFRKIAANPKIEVDA